MKLAALSFILLLVSCGKTDSQPSYSGPSNLMQNWRGQYESPSLQSIEANSLQSASRWLICNGSFPEVYNGIPSAENNYNSNSPIYPDYNSPYGYNQPSTNYYNSYPSTYPSNYYNNYYYPTSGSYYNTYPNNYYNQPAGGSNQAYRNTYQTRPTVTNVVKNYFRVSPTNENEGYLYFGELPYYGASNPHCEFFSGQTFRYEVSGNRLLICLQPPNSNICFDYDAF